MSTRTVTECDVCNDQMKKAGKWSKVWIVDNTFGCCNLEVFDQIDFAGMDVKDSRDVCGIDHATLLYQRWLDHGSFDDGIQDRLTPEIGMTA